MVGLAGLFEVPSFLVAASSEGFDEVGETAFDDSTVDEGEIEAFVFCAFGDVVVTVLPIVRALEAPASALAFSRMAFCLSSSLAKIVTRSSGMGRLS